MTLPRLELRTERPQLVSGEKQTVDVLLRITPPDPEGDRARPKLNIGIALDRSGSMGGDKMREAREASKYCVDQLLESDRFSAVIFDDEVDVLFTNQLVIDRSVLKRGLDRIEAHGSTALHQGWVTAGLQVSEALDLHAVNRVLLITDGQANVGETRVDELVCQAREAAARGVTTSTIGIGRDFNEDLLMPMAEAGEGNAWHVEEAADMAKIFETEMNGLVRQVGHSVRLTVETPSGVRVAEVLNDFERDGDAWRLPNLLAGSRLDVVIRLEIAGGAANDGDVAKCVIQFKKQADGQAASVDAVLSPSFTARSEADAAAADTAVVEAGRLLMNARARREAMEHLDRGDHSASLAALRSVVRSTRSTAASAPSPLLDAELQDLEDLEDRVSRRRDPIMARKMALYQSERKRKGR